MTNTAKGITSVTRVANILIQQGMRVSVMPTAGRESPYDLLVNWKRVEVKVCPCINNTWKFNIHRHGDLDESMVDFYIFRLENVPGFKAAIHLVIPSPIGQKVLAISLRSLLCRFGRYYNRFDLLGGKNKGTSPAIKNGDIVNYPED